MMFSEEYRNSLNASINADFSNQMIIDYTKGNNIETFPKEVLEISFGNQEETNCGELNVFLSFSIDYLVELFDIFKKTKSYKKLQKIMKEHDLINQRLIEYQLIHIK